MYCWPPFFNSTPLGRNKYKCPNIWCLAKTESLMMFKKHSWPRQFNQFQCLQLLQPQTSITHFSTHIAWPTRQNIQNTYHFGQGICAEKWLLEVRSCRSCKHWNWLNCVGQECFLNIIRDSVSAEHKILGRLYLFQPRGVLLKNGGQQYVFSAEKKKYKSGSHTMPLDELCNNRGGWLCLAEISTSEIENASCLQPQGSAGTAARLKSFDTSWPKTHFSDPPYPIT